MLEADLILHVRDISHAETENQATDVATIMAELGVAEETKQFEVWNKIDLLPASEVEPLLTQADRHDDIFAVSAITGAGIDAMLDAVSESLTDEKTERDLELPFADGKKRAWLHAEGVVEDESQTETGFALKLRWTARQEKAFREL